MIQLTDQSIMSFGKYKGHKLANVPAEYLLFIYAEYDLQAPLKKYIADNLQGLKQEVKLAKAEKRL
ncbi:MAG TPA: DUF3820 family protein [Niabella sp.]|nr:DUF3820 family protein [Niabella sp.]